MNPSALPTGQRGRIVAVAMGVIVIAVLWLVAVQPLIDWYAARDQALDDRIRYEQRMAGVAASLPAVQASADAAAIAGAPSPILLAGSSDAIAGASLEGLIDGMAHDAQTDLISTEAMPAVQQSGFRRIGLHVAVRAAYANLVQLLSAVERANPRMSVGDLQLQAGPLAGPDQLLDLTFSVMAFRAGTGGDAQPPTDSAPDDTAAGGAGQ